MEGATTQLANDANSNRKKMETNTMSHSILQQEDVGKAQWRESEMDQRWQGKKSHNKMYKQGKILKYV